MKNNPLSSINPCFDGDNGDVLLCQNFEGCLNVALAQMFSVGVLSSHGIEQATAAENLGAKVLLMRSRLCQFLQEGVNRDVAVARRCDAPPVPDGKEEMGCPAYPVYGIPNADRGA